MTTTRLYLSRPAGRKTKIRLQQAAAPPPPPAQLPLPKQPRWSLPLVWMTTVRYAFSSSQTSSQLASSSRKALANQAFVRCWEQPWRSFRRWSGLDPKACLQRRTPSRKARPSLPESACPAPPPISPPSRDDEDGLAGQACDWADPEREGVRRSVGSDSTWNNGIWGTDSI